ncbi:MAG: creatininase family protein [Planctomycetes bacterium]|nr:creatininase family protein [Planctomycetota bacterium]
MTLQPAPRSYVLMEANYRQLLDSRPNVAVLPWGATEAHNYHLPYGTDVLEATALAERAAALAVKRGAKPLVLPTIPFGNNAQQQDQVATIHLSTATALALLRDVAESLRRQGIDRLVVLNAHGGNDLKPLVRDVMLQCEILVVVVNFWQVREDARKSIFTQPGDHADVMETSLMLHLRPELVVMNQAGLGSSVPWKLNSLQQPGVWTPRSWSHVHPDTGSGDPKQATAAKGARYFEIITAAIADVLVELSAATKGDVPYV